MHHAQGRYSPAQSRYNRRILWLSIAYALIVLPATWLLTRQLVSGGLALLLSVLPALPICGYFLAMGRYLSEETDEYLRMLQVRLLLTGTGILLSVMVVWGFLEQFGFVPHVAANWWPLVWVVGCALASCGQAFSNRRDAGADQ